MSHFRESLVQLPMDRRGVFMGIAVSLTVLVDALITTAFWTASWMVFDDTAAMVPKPVMPFRLPFHKLGLWDLCFRLYQRGNPFNPFSVVCELMVKMPNFQASVPGFIIAVEVFFTVGFGLAGLASLILIFTLICGENRSLLRAIGILFLTAGFFACLAVIIFASCYNNRNTDNRLFQWEENLSLGWSYWVTVGGSVSLWLCGICYFVESRLLADRLRNSLITKIIY